MQTIDGMALAFQRLVFRVLDGRVIPFVGAGISLQAHDPDDSEFKPAVWWLRDEVKKSCDALMHDGNVKPPVTIGRAGEKENGEWLAREKLDHLADLVTWLAGAAHLCKVLRIEAFARLSLLPAHRFLAYFAREGLFPEIITTNYDTCIERAFRASFGVNPDAPADDRANDALAVIFNLGHYRAHAGRSQTSHGDPVLHLYKINGDAADYQTALDEFARDHDAGRLERRAARIIVTERQLQTFRDELWAKDLYADRSRSRSLLFCGFGSDEPQVRHHAMTLMEEMQRQSRPVLTWDKIPELPNAPFISVYEDELSFNQLQILAGFAMAHTRAGTPHAGAPVLKAAFANAFLANFGKMLKDGETNLLADLFFTKLFQTVWLRRVEAELEPGGVFPVWLRSVVKEHRAWAAWLRDRLCLTNECDKHRFGHLEPGALKPTTNELRAVFFGLATQLFGEMDPKNHEPGLLMQWMYAVATGGRKPPKGTDYYLSLREAPLFILCTLQLVLWMTHDNKKPQDGLAMSATAVPGIGLKVTFSLDDNPPSERSVYLVREGVREQPLQWQSPVPNIVWLIEIPGNDRFDESHSAPVTSGVHPEPLQSVKVVRRSAAAVFRAARTPHTDVFSVLNRVFTHDIPDEAP